MDQLEILEQRIEKLVSTDYTETQKELMRKLLQTFMLPIYPNDVENILFVVHKCRLLSSHDLETTTQFLSLLESSGLQSRNLI